ncbi:MAG TPA: site-2 protease family protein [Clostridiales bacterium]|nr:site-2 protease family protein [Clostridiales bacterium]
MFRDIFTIEFWISLLYVVPGFLFAISIHEFAHAYAAYKLGDPTARNLGRMTLNPFAHLDIVGTLLLIFVGFGFAKPVPVNPRNYKGNKSVADTIVSLAGITANFIVALLGLLLLNALFALNFSNQTILIMLQYLVIINITLMVFNLVPIPPLDGSHIAENLLIRHVGVRPFMFMRKYQTYLLIAFFLIIRSTGLISTVTLAIYNFLNRGFGLIFG